MNIPEVTSKNREELAKAKSDKCMYTGDGEDAYDMRELKKSGFDVFVRKQVAAGKLLFGICVGSQIIFEHSEEGDTECLGLVKGSIRHFYSINPELKNQNMKVPHMGWNNLSFQNGDCPILKGIKNDFDVYFVHSYVICPSDPSVVKASADYGIKVPAVIQSGNIFATQFHPEKSGEMGIQILKNFCES